VSPEFQDGRINLMAAHPSSESAEGLSKHRIEALSDGIFAFAMTLLVLDVKIPKLPEAAVQAGQLGPTLLALWPKFFSYGMSFVVLGVFWVGQHGYAHFLKRTDRWLLWINLLFLMFIVGVPFSTDLLGDYPTQKVAVMIYGGNIMALGLTLYLQWWYATRGHRLVGRDLEPEIVRKGTQRMLGGVVVYGCAVLLALLNPILSLILYAVIPLFYLLPSPIDHHWTHSHG